MAPDRGRPLVFVTLAFHPDTAATSILFTDLFTRMVGQGVRVTVLCGFPTKDSAEEVRALPRRETYQGIEILRCGVRIQGKRSVLTRAVAYGAFLLHAGWRLQWLGSGAAVFGGTDPPFLPIGMWLASRTRRFAYNLVLLDIYPDGLVALGALGRGSLPARLWLRLNRLAYQAAERVVVIGRDMGELVRDRYGVTPSQVVYIPHWAPEDVERPPEASGDWRQELGLEGKFVVQYSGNMGLWHDIDTLVRAAALLTARTDIHFVFIGKGMRRAGAERLAQELGLRNIMWQEFIPREDLAESLRQCDVALISMRDGLAGVAVPSKLYGILASGRPAVAQAPADSEVARVVAEEGCGFVVSPGDADSLAAAIVTLADNSALVEEMGARARAAYDSKYTIDRASTRFRALL